MGGGMIGTCVKWLAIRAKYPSLQRFCPRLFDDHLTSYSSNSSAFSTQPTSEHDPTKIKIPVPWGHVSGKDWGPSSGKPLLALHGWLQNCGTFDLLAPLLPREWRLVSIDLPGHGFSSHLPPGMAGDFMVDVATVHRVTKYLGWSNFSILGHSIGAAIGIMYSCVFPDEVEKLITLDIGKGASRSLSDYLLGAKASIDSAMDLEVMLDSKPSPKYSHQEAFDRLLKGYAGTLTPRSVEMIMKRGSKPAKDDPSKVVFTHDPRLLTPFLQVPTPEQMLHFITMMRCEVLMVMVPDSPQGILHRLHPPEVSKVVRNMKEYLREQKLQEKETVRLHEKNDRHFRYVQVPGNHFVHLNQPENVAHHIADFLRS